MIANPPRPLARLDWRWGGGGIINFQFLFINCFGAPATKLSPAAGFLLFVRPKRETENDARFKSDTKIEAYHLLLIFWCQNPMKRDAASPACALFSWEEAGNKNSNREA